MLKIAMCEDSQESAKKLCGYIEVWGEQHSVKNSIKWFRNSEDFLKHISIHSGFDLIFLDICLGRMDGIELGARIREAGILTPIIYCSSYDRYVKQLFKVKPQDFLDKPLLKEELFRVMEPYRDWNRKQKEIYLIQCGQKGSKGYYINLYDTVYFSSRRRTIKMYSIHSKIPEFYMRLDTLEKDLKNRTNQFIRIHQSYLVNLEYITRFEYQKVILKSGEELPISAGRRPQIRKLHMNLMAASFHKRKKTQNVTY